MRILKVAIKPIIIVLLAMFLLYSCGTFNHVACSKDNASTIEDQASFLEKLIHGKIAPKPASDGASADSVKGEMRMTFIDVGQGDAAFIELPDGLTVLCDAGNTDDYEAIADVIGDHKEIDIVVATHPHADHIGVMPEIIKNFKIKNFYLPNKPATTEIYEKMLNSLQNKGGTKVIVPTAGDVIAAGEGYKITVLSPPSNMFYEDTNDYSIVLRIDYGTTSVLLTGDASLEILNSLDNIDADVDVLKVSHHGSYTGTDVRLLNAVTPEYSIISYGEGNDYGHPHNETVDALRIFGGAVLETAREGNVELLSDGKEFRRVA